MQFFPKESSTNPYNQSEIIVAFNNIFIGKGLVKNILKEVRYSLTVSNVPTLEFQIEV